MNNIPLTSLSLVLRDAMSTYSSNHEVVPRYAIEVYEWLRETLKHPFNDEVMLPIPFPPGSYFLCEDDCDPLA